MMIDPGEEMKKNMDTLTPWMIPVQVTKAGNPFCRLDENAPDDIKALYYKVFPDMNR